MVSLAKTKNNIDESKKISGQTDQPGRKNKYKIFYNLKSLTVFKKLEVPTEALCGDQSSPLVTALREKYRANCSVLP